MSAFLAFAPWALITVLLIAAEIRAGLRDKRRPSGENLALVLGLSGAALVWGTQP